MGFSPLQLALERNASIEVVAALLQVYPEAEDIMDSLLRVTYADKLAEAKALLASPSGSHQSVLVAAEVGQTEVLQIRTCCVCICPEPRAKGLECDAAEPHFVCDACFSFYVNLPRSVYFRNEDGKLLEVAQDSACIKCVLAPDCTAGFTVRAAAQHATPQAFEQMQRHLEDIKQVVQECSEEQVEEQRRHRRAALASMPEGERQALAARPHIEEMMNLRCPKCRGVFESFEGCVCVTCAYPGCQAKFCALCGEDAAELSHVFTCRLNPNPNSGFVSNAQWVQVMDGQRRERLQAYWTTLEHEVKGLLCADASIRKIFSDLRLDGLLSSDAFKDQAAARKASELVAKLKARAPDSEMLPLITTEVAATKLHVRSLRALLCQGTD